MTVYRPKDCTAWRYDFEYNGERHTGTTNQIRKEDAVLVEAKLKLRLRQQQGGIAPFDPEETPRFQDWAKVYLAYQRRFVTRPDIVKRAVDVVLEFCGAKPTSPKALPAVVRRAKVEAPYHDLRLGDFIANSQWLLTLQEWIVARGVSGSTRNTYLSTLSGFYRVALEPEYRAVSGLDKNPFEHIRRSPRNSRVIALEADVVLAWIRAAPYHVALAATIAALAPKLRLQTILQLRWKEHFDAGLTKCTVYAHKTAAATGRPQVTPLSVQLQELLAFQRQRSTSKFVITYHDEPIASIKTATRRAAESVGLTWGVADGVTFHTFRHSIATLLAELGMSESFRKALLGHKEIRTTQQYTHLAAKSQIAPHEALSAAMPLKDLVMAKAPKQKPREDLRESPAEHVQTGPKTRKHAKRQKRRSVA